MTGASFDFDPVDRFTAGAVGQPGHRVFFLQASKGEAIVTLLADKEQVAALAASIRQILSLLPEGGEEEDPREDELELVEPLVQEWRAGRMALEFDESRERFVLLIEEALPEEDEGDAASLRVTLSRAQAERLAARSAALVAAGRPQCRVCGLPMDPEGHVCPALNGHRGEEA